MYSVVLYHSLNIWSLAFQGFEMRTSRISYGILTFCHEIPRRFLVMLLLNHSSPTGRDTTVLSLVDGGTGSGGIVS
jgi:hypothetical protein